MAKYIYHKGTGISPDMGSRPFQGPIVRRDDLFLAYLYIYLHIWIFLFRSYRSACSTPDTRQPWLRWSDVSPGRGHTTSTNHIYTSERYHIYVYVSIL